MKIELKELHLTNFKGIKNISIAFGQQTNIFGANEAGKTTITDGWHWLLFGKDSYDRKDFNIKNTVHTELNRQEHEVSGIISIDGVDTELKHVYKEKWTKKRGEQFAEMTGHEHLYYWNEVPCSVGEYNAKIGAILNESIFKLITNPNYFNSLKWQERRNVLFEIAGNITNEELAGDNPQFVTLLASLNNQKSLAEYKREIALKKKKIKTDLEAIPYRIDEINKGLPEEMNWTEIQDEISSHQKELASVEESMTNKSKAYESLFKSSQEKQNEVHRLKTRLNDISFKVRTDQQKKADNIRFKKNELQQRIDDTNRYITSKTNLLTSTKTKQDELKLRTDSLRQLWASTNEKELEFEAHLFECPTCRRALEEGDIEAKKAEILSNFQEDKQKGLAEINAKGKQLVQETKECDDMIADLEKAIKTLKDDLFIAKQELQVFETNNSNTQSIEDILRSNDEYVKVQSQISSLEAQKGDIPEIDLSELKQSKAEILRTIDSLKTQLSSKDVIARSKNRITELEAEERNLAQQLADLEGIEFTIDEFNKAKIDAIEERINSKFQYVSFKMFDRQINGGEVETCETMYKGVPFSDLNTAGKIWAGIDIIKTLSNHYDVSAPIFLDNRESVTEIPQVESQIINLIVSPGDKQLRVVA